ncbi:MAG: ATP-binding cassette domain-containing protein [Bifidobacterium pseudocatenulatum]
MSFSVSRRDHGPVGESGCGKSITSLAIMGLLDRSRDQRRDLFDGKNLVGMDPKEHNALRGHEIAMIYQDALSSLNPSMLIKAQMKQLTSAAAPAAPRNCSSSWARSGAHAGVLPHELSGGQPSACSSPWP